MINLVIEEKVKFVTTSAGDPAKYIHILKDAGIKVFHAVPSLAGALKAIKAGVDGLVVEGTEGADLKILKKLDFTYYCSLLESILIYQWLRLEV